MRNAIDPVQESGWPEIDMLDGHTSVEIQPPQGWFAWTKIATDYIVALWLLIPALPVIAICWVAVKVTSKGPGIYSQTRLGKNGRPYAIYKLRSMTVNAEASGAQWAKKVDMRVTTLGKFLRATHLDELPQLFNVLKGDMSLVGPRPERPEMIHQMGLNQHVPGYAQRLLVKPGVTGLAQLQVPADSDLNSVRHKVVYDLYYIENVGVLFDLRIIVGTLFKSAGLSPVWLRRLFFFPSREAVAQVFYDNLTSAQPSGTHLIPA
ncbi:MAG: sugar transferase [Gemmataceae bacterium]